MAGTVTPAVLSGVAVGVGELTGTLADGVVGASTAGVPVGVWLGTAVRLVGGVVSTVAGVTVWLEVGSAVVGKVVGAGVLPSVISGPG